MTMTGRRDVRTMCQLACALPTAVTGTVLVAAMAWLQLGDLSATWSRVVAWAAVVAALAALSVAWLAGEFIAERVEQRLTRLVAEAEARERQAAARQVYDRCGSLRELIGRSLDELHQYVGAVNNGEYPVGSPLGQRPAGTDPFEAVAYDLHRVQIAAQAAVFDMAEAGRREREAAGRQVYDRCGSLRELIGRGVGELHQFVEAVMNGEDRVPGELGERPETADPFELVAYEIRRVQVSAQRAVLDVTRVRIPPVGLRADVVNTLALRMQGGIYRALQALEKVQAQVDDPDLLELLYFLDHLIVLLRRQAENLAVIGGGTSGRLWTTPVSVTTTIRAAVQEIEHYARVRWVPPPADSVVRGDVVSDLIHLLAELVENATLFAPRDRVWVRAEKVPAGLAIEVEDKGLGFDDDAARRRMNELLADPGRVSLDELLSDGRIGLWVVGQLAGRHGVVVQLKQSMYGGVLAVVVLPHDLLAPAAIVPAVPVAQLSRAEAAPDVPAPVLSAASAAALPAGSGFPGGQPAGPLPVRTPDGCKNNSNDNSTDNGKDNGSAGRQDSAGPSDDGPPPLPQRVKQQNLAPQLRQPPASGGDGGDVADTDLAFTASLLGSFRESDSSQANTSPADTEGTGGTNDGDSAG